MKLKVEFALVLINNAIIRRGANGFTIQILT